MVKRYGYQKPPSPRRQKTITFVGVGIGVLLIVGFGLYLLSRPSDATTSMQRLVARMTTLEAIAKDATKNTRSDQNRKANSELSLHVTGDIPALREVASTRGIKLEKKLTTDPEQTELLDELKAAAVNDNYDEVYQRVTAGKINETLDLLAAAQRNLKSRDARETLDGVAEHLEGVLAQLKE